MTRVALLGFGEVGRALAAELPVELRAYDTAFVDASSRASFNATSAGLVPSATPAAAVSEAEFVISAVTAANTLAAASSVVGALATGCWFVDLNSAAPTHKCAAADMIDAAGGRYVEVAVMSPIEPKRLASPMLVGGPHARAFLEAATPLGFSDAAVYADTVGPAAATKLCRSIIVKGLEALMTESMVTARAWGVEQAVLDSLANLLPAADWDALAAYLVSRSLLHGTRRAEEMREAARTVADTGIEPWLAEATAFRQERTAQFGPPSSTADLRAMIDAIRAGANR